MNENFISVLEASGKTVRRLAFALDTTMEELLDPVHVMDGVCGKYKGIKFLWMYEAGEMRLRMDDHGKISMESTGIGMTGVETRIMYDAQRFTMWTNNN